MGRPLTKLFLLLTFKKKGRLPRATLTDYYPSVHTSVNLNQLARRAPVTTRRPCLRLALLPQFTFNTIDEIKVIKVPSSGVRIQRMSNAMGGSRRLFQDQHTTDSILHEIQPKNLKGNEQIKSSIKSNVNHFQHWIYVCMSYLFIRALFY